MSLPSPDTLRRELDRERARNVMLADMLDQTIRHARSLSDDMVTANHCEFATIALQTFRAQEMTDG